MINFQLITHTCNNYCAYILRQQLSPFTDIEGKFNKMMLEIGFVKDKREDHREKEEFDSLYYVCIMLSIIIIIIIMY